MSTPPIWLGGWGVSPASVRAALPPGQAEHAIVRPPTPAALELALNSPAGTPLAGWSLGAHLLLRALAAGDPRTAGRQLTLVCPFVAFPVEADRGGRIPLPAVKFLRKWVRRAPAEALADFYTRAGLRLTSPPAAPYPPEELEAGFAFLEDPVGFDPAKIDAHQVILLLGARDPLIDATRIASLMPGARVLPDAGHDLNDYRNALPAY